MRAVYFKTGAAEAVCIEAMIPTLRNADTAAVEQVLV